MAWIDPGRTDSASAPGAGADGLQLRLLGPSDMEQAARLLLGLTLTDRNARFHSGVSDYTVIAYVRRLDPARAVLVGVFGSAGWLLGFAEAHPTPLPRTVEVAVTVDRRHRRRGLGRRLAAAVVAYSFAAGAQRAEFLFTSSNPAFPGLPAAFGAKIDLLRRHAVISSEVQEDVCQRTPYVLGGQSR